MTKNEFIKSLYTMDLENELTKIKIAKQNSETEFEKKPIIFKDEDITYITYSKNVANKKTYNLPNSDTLRLWEIDATQGWEPAQILVDINNDYALYIKELNRSSNHKSDFYKLNDPNHQILNNIIENICYAVSHESINTHNNLIKMIAKLLYVQQKTLNVNILKDKKDRNKTQLAPAMNEFLSKFNLDDSTSKNHVNVTFSDVADFINDVTTKNETDKDNVMTWLLSNMNLDTTSSDELNETIIPLIEQFGINNNLIKLKVEKIKEIEKLIDLTTDEQEKRKIKITNIWAIDNQKNDLSKYENKMIAVHGTRNASILTIIRDGLKTRNEIAADASASYTGLGLGDGVYFAQTNQIGKSLNYASRSKNTTYLFLNEIGYNNIVKTNTWGNHMVPKNDILIASDMGQFARDEILVKDSKQINTNYLIEITIE